MDNEQKQTKTPISEQKIFKIMLTVTFVVASVFLLKNILGKSLQGSLAIGICLAIFAVAIVGMRFLNASLERRQLVVSLSLIFIIFIISLFSGDYYSDDFPLYLAAIGMTGLYLRPNYTKIQLIMCDILLILQYVLHPEKAESMGQFIMCVVIFSLAAYLIFLTINRGRAYTEISQSRAKEAEKLLHSLNQLGEELEKNFEKSSKGIDDLRKTNFQLNENTEELKQGSSEIVLGAQEVATTCDDVQQKVRATEKQVVALTDGVHNVEDALATNRKNLREMNTQMESVQHATSQVNDVFRLLEQHMKEISAVTEQLDSISSSTTMLALNASIEAARAGQSGAGFAVVASKVQELAVDSNKCSAQVADVVNQMQQQIQETTKQLAESSQAIQASLETLDGLQDGFDQLTEQFDSLYQNIETQNSNVNEVDTIFEQLRGKIAEVSQYSQENENTVTSITDAMSLFKESMELMADDTRQVHELSANMLELSRQ